MLDNLFHTKALGLLIWCKARSSLQFLQEIFIVNQDLHNSFKMNHTTQSYEMAATLAQQRSKYGPHVQSAQQHLPSLITY